MLELPEANAHGPPVAPAVEAGETDAELALSILLALVLPLQFSIIQQKCKIWHSQNNQEC